MDIIYIKTVAYLFKMQLGTVDIILIKPTQNVFIDRFATEN